VSITTPEWVKDAVFYQVFPDRFARSGRVDDPGEMEAWDAPPTHHGFKGGDLYGVADRLDYLGELGVTAIYLNPIFASASNHRYHTYDYMVVDPLLGGDAALRELLDRAHARGIRVVLDGVFNHASRGFWPFNHVLECGIGSPYLDWFHVDRDALAAGRPLRAYPDESLRHALEQAGGADRFGTESGSGLGYRAWWNLPALPKLNTDNPKVRAYLMGVAEHWIRFGADGWRLDVAAEIDDDEFWREFRRRVKAVNPDAYIVAEIWTEDHRWLQGDQFDAYMNYPLGFAALSFASGGHRDQAVIDQHGDVRDGVRPEDGPGFLARVHHQLTTYDPAITAVQLNLLGSHDMPRILSICAGDTTAVRLATLVQMTVPGAPCIYYGDEIGMAGTHDPYCRGAFPADESAWDRVLLAYVRGLTALRHAHPCLRRGDFTPAGADGMAAAYLRAGEGGSFVIALNAGEDPAVLEVVVGAIPGATLAPVTPAGWAWPAGDPVRVEGGQASIALPARGARILRAG
jgi:cyclomaltodextrinase / maltogenic alpha-amylase / neopullulanase